MKHALHCLILIALATTPALASATLLTEARKACSSLAQRSAHCQLVGGFEKTALEGDIAQFSITLKVGPQDQDLIRIHRVTRISDGAPITSERAVFLTHGNLFGFAQTFLAGSLSDNVPANQSMAVFLANRDIDVWGIDLRWTQVTGDKEDLSFMASWNLGTDVADVRKAMLIARAVRTATGSGPGRLHLAGWSSGGIINYALANLETKLPPWARHARTLIPMDTMYRVDPVYPQVMASACNRYQLAREAIDNGVFHSDEGSQVAALTWLARTDPEGDSPALPGLSNRQAILFLVGKFPDPNPLVPSFHQLAVSFDAAGIPLELRFSDEPFMQDFLLSAAPFISLGQRADFEQIFCAQIPSVHADSLDKITLPVLYVGAGGGFGAYGNYTQSLLGSTDVTNMVIRLESQDLRAADLGHSELFTARDAQALAWQPIYEWMLSH